MTLKEKIEEAVEAIKAALQPQPEVAIVLGSGLGALAEKLEKPQSIDYSEIPYWPRSTTPGHVGKLVAGELSGVPVIIMQGRVHYYEGYTMEEVTFPVRALKLLGVESLVLTNASGGINPEVDPGTLIAIEDHINFMGVNPLVGENIGSFGPRFPDMTKAYDKEYLEKLVMVAEREQIPLERGTYIAFSGPSFETPAEIKMARIMGADAVGMSTVPEVIVANHMGMRVCGISCVANFAAGITNQRLTHEEVLATMNAAADSVCTLISNFLKEL
jgi:purine-nucleoside phosphorylase